jgi:hypothetical protein
MRVRVDQTGDDPAAGDIDLTSLPRQLEAGSLVHRFNSTAANDNDRIGQCRAPATIDEGGTHECYPIIRGRLAPEQQ